MIKLKPGEIMTAHSTQSLRSIQVAWLQSPALRNYAMVLYPQVPLTYLYMSHIIAKTCE